MERWTVTDPLVQKLSKRDRISEEEEQALASSVQEIREFEADQDIITEGSEPTFSTLILDGFAARYRDLSSGKRQITAIQISGDFVDLHSLLLKKMDHGVLALTRCRVALVPHERLRQITERYPHLTRMFWLSTLIDAAIHREWLVSLGRRSPVAHMAHLMRELSLRLEVVGLTEGKSFRFPVTQAELGDVMGLSTVHVNRSLQQLRGERCITWEGDKITITDFKRLEEIAEFDATYLSLMELPR
jgi:CRP-like cAMP-binding protein